MLAFFGRPGTILNRLSLYMPRFLTMFGAFFLLVTVGFGCKQAGPSTGTLSTDVFTLTAIATQMSTNANVSTVINRATEENETLGEGEYIIEISTGDNVISESDFTARYTITQPVELITSPPVNALYGKESATPEYANEVGYLYGNVAYIRVQANTATGAAAGREALNALSWK